MPPTHEQEHDATDPGITGPIPSSSNGSGWLSDGRILAMLGLLIGGGGATAGSVGVDLLGLSALRADVAAIEAQIETIDTNRYAIERIQERMDRAEIDDRELAATLERIERNVFRLCEKTGAGCKE